MKFHQTNFHNEVTFFHEATFIKQTIFDGTGFHQAAKFDDALFQGGATFVRTRFYNGVCFNRTKFSKSARFNELIISGRTVFNQVQFVKYVGFKQTTFQHEANFDGTMFHKGATFSRVHFQGYGGFTRSEFRGNAVFTAARFEGNAYFKGARFGRAAKFDEVEFKKNSVFAKTRFSCDAKFAFVKFRGDAVFVESTFFGDVRFTRAQFYNDAIFTKAKFTAYVEFNQAIFESNTKFLGAIFEKDSAFVAIKGVSFFTIEQAEFYAVPDFSQASFAEAPRLDNSYFHPASMNRNEGARLRASGDRRDVTARWRALRRLAIQAHDHERELIFLAEEIKSLRDTQDWLLPNPLMMRAGEPVCWPGGGRYWAGLFYQFISDFGRTTLRPFLGWLLLTCTFAMFYFSHYSAAVNQSNISVTIPAIASVDCEPYMAALYLSVHNGLVISGLGRSDKLAQSYACLYGSSGKAQLVPVMPDTVVFAGIGQTVLSAVLIFLFLLALRNYFRIK